MINEKNILKGLQVLLVMLITVACLKGQHTYNPAQRDVLDIECYEDGTDRYQVTTYLENGSQVAIAIPENGLLKIDVTAGTPAGWVPCDPVNFTEVIGDVEATLGVYDTPTLIPNATYVSINTGIDLTNAYRIEIDFDSSNGQGSTASKLMEHIVLDDDLGGLFHWFSNIYLRIRINTADISSGIMSFSLIGNSNFTINEIRVTQIAKGTSRRIGEIVVKKSSLFTDDADAMSKGYLPIKSGTVIDGALNFPLWAAAYSEFVTGNDIVFPTNVDGITFRNVGGNAGAEGTFQAFATNVDGILAPDRYAPAFTGRGTGGNVARNGNTTTNRALLNGAVETRSANYGYQHYFIVDTYYEAKVSGVTVTNPNGSGYLKSNEDGTTATFIDNDGTSDLFKQLDNWTKAANSTLTDSVDDNGIYVDITNTGGGWAPITSTSFLPTAENQTVKIVWDMDPTATHTAAIRLNAGVRDLILDVGTGEATPQANDLAFLNVVSNTIIGNIVTTIFEVTADAGYISWDIFSDYGLTGTLGSNPNAVGDLRVRFLNLAHIKEKVISEDNGQLAELGSDDKVLLKNEYTLVFDDIGGTRNVGGGSVSGKEAGIFFVEHDQTVKIRHTVFGINATNGAGFGITTIPLDDDAAGIANPFSIGDSTSYTSTGDRVNATTTSKEYDVALKKGKYHIGVFSGGTNTVESHRLDIILSGFNNDQDNQPLDGNHTRQVFDWSPNSANVRNGYFKITDNKNSSTHLDQLTINNNSTKEFFVFGQSYVNDSQTTQDLQIGLNVIVTCTDGKISYELGADSKFLNSATPATFEDLKYIDLVSSGGPAYMKESQFNFFFRDLRIENTGFPSLDALSIRQLEIDGDLKNGDTYYNTDRGWLQTYVGNPTNDDHIWPWKILGKDDVPNRPIFYGDVTQSNAVGPQYIIVGEYNFTQPGTYTVMHDLINNTGTNGFAITTSEPTQANPTVDVVYTSEANRVVAPSSQEIYTDVVLDGGVDYYFSAWSGGGSTSYDHYLEVIDCVPNTNGAQLNRETVFDVTPITATNTTLVYNAGTNPANGGSILNDGVITRIGTQAKINFEYHNDDDDAIVLDLSSTLPTGASITSLNAVANDAAEDPYADVGLTITSPTSIRINRADGINNDLSYQMTIWVEGYPDFQEYGLPVDIPVDNTGVSDDDVLQWDSTQSAYIPKAKNLLISTGGVCYILSVDDAGNLITTLTTCP